MITVKASVAIGSRSWSFHRDGRRDPATVAVAALMLTVGLLASAVFTLALLPVHLVLRAAGKPGIIEASLNS